MIRNSKGQFVKGHLFLGDLTKDNFFKKGHIPWVKTHGHSEVTKEKLSKIMLGKNKGNKHYLWKNSEVGYSALHKWVCRWKGKPSICEECGISEKLQWANRSGEYKRDLSDWISLCISCHHNYDKIWEKRIRDGLGRFV